MDTLNLRQSIWGLVMSFRTGWLAAILGAVLAQLAVIPLAFLCGAIFGAERMWGPGQEFGVRGGTNAVEILMIIYLVSYGIVPLVVSGVGALVALGVRWFIQHKHSENQNQIEKQPALVEAETRAKAAEAEAVRLRSELERLRREKMREGGEETGIRE
jgi:hypothetical protein